MSIIAPNELGTAVKASMVYLELLTGGLLSVLLQRAGLESVELVVNHWPFGFHIAQKLPEGSAVFRAPRREFLEWVGGGGLRGDVLLHLLLAI